MAIWRILAAKPGAVVWTEEELARALNADTRHIRVAMDEQFMGGAAVPGLRSQGWRRA